MAGEDKQWVSKVFGSENLRYNRSHQANLSQASKYLLDPLTAPEPSEETGPGTHHISTLSHNNPYRNSTVSGSPSARKPSPEKSARTSIKSVHTPRSSVGYPTPPSSRSSRTPQFDNTPISSSRNSASNISTQIPTSTGGQYSSHSRRSRHIENTPTASARNSLSNASTQIPTSTGGRTSNTGRPSRHNSLPSRYAGDKSNRPLETLIRENKKAYRAPHLRKQFIPGFDSIDTLDKATSPYHHEGPYDATLLSRNLKTFTSPVAAVRGTNEEALKAPPPEMIQDSLKKHRPLDGVAIVPPGMQDLNGRTYDYVEGTDLMRENGADYKRWPGVVCHLFEWHLRRITRRVGELTSYRNTFPKTSKAKANRHIPSKKLSKTTKDPTIAEVSQMATKLLKWPHPVPHRLHLPLSAMKLMGIIVDLRAQDLALVRGPPIKTIRIGKVACITEDLVGA